MRADAPGRAAAPVQPTACAAPGVPEPRAVRQPSGIPRAAAAPAGPLNAPVVGFPSCSTAFGSPPPTSVASGGEGSGVGALSSLGWICRRRRSPPFVSSIPMLADARPLHLTPPGRASGAGGGKPRGPATIRLFGEAGGLRAEICG